MPLHHLIIPLWQLSLNLCVFFRPECSKRHCSITPDLDNLWSWNFIVRQPLYKQFVQTICTRNNFHQQTFSHDVQSVFYKDLFWNKIWSDHEINIVNAWTDSFYWTKTQVGSTGGSKLVYLQSTDHSLKYTFSKLPNKSNFKQTVLICSLTLEFYCHSAMTSKIYENWYCQSIYFFKLFAIIKGFEQICFRRGFKGYLSWN